MRILPTSLGISLLVLTGCWASGTTTDQKEAAGPGAPNEAEAGVLDGSGDDVQSPNEPAGDTAGDEGGGDSPPASPGAPPPVATPDLVTAEQIQAAFSAHLEGLKKDGDGLLRMFDDRNSEDLELEFQSVTPGARKVEGRGYLVEAKFAAKGGEEGRMYDLHFWLNFRTDRDDKAEATALDVTDTRIFRVPKKTNGAWTMEARYDIANERPVAVK